MTTAFTPWFASIPQSLTAGLGHYQDPSPTPTPEWMQTVVLQPGAQLLLERRISYGDIAVVVALMALALLILFIAFVTLPRLWKVD